MGAGTGEQVERGAAAPPSSHRATAVGPGAVVVLRRPWRLRGRSAVVRRRVHGGWEVEVRSPLGTPLHLVVRERALRAA